MENTSSHNSVSGEEYANDEESGTQVKCPDCNDLVSLASLHQHLKTSCPTKGVVSIYNSN